ncbi:L-seryl-tRNA(Sec) selenium transferase [Bacillus sp. ISL-47]|uniref:L-seryl-tRNA(Sec) selenium transferase n=1 Tax=Bacillus sp. ISL-47 TaxID=2819130 RepID=UPI001BEAF0F5|nr:L-seryl-tRNA(Sec) selenium transferase [Bacillus sp. ISL-47]MBT2689630.1 L-seryl-tRNA(Sec) selenium transferase [Bacillus sp. ISL-47]MBT2708449.1 L-seryl-tRNA(Sec) selenium transferase [Pseudomonas sp. ISL-84]
MKNRLRNIPPVHELQKEDRFNELLIRHGLDTIQVTNIMKDVISDIRQDILSARWNNDDPGTKGFSDILFQRVEEAIMDRYSYTLKRLINATGTILHTNLGRARLSSNAAAHMLETAMNYSNLEYKLAEGERGSRHIHVEGLVKELTGAEAAMVVNNNAAAVYFILKALAADNEVIVSRGQLVEIGGSFRISSIMEESGAKLAEVGTTNKTHLSDYEKAINEETAMILKVHTSNFKIIGFTKEVGTGELADLAKEKNVIFYEDLGSGALFDFKSRGIGEEPIVSEVIKLGADIVSFSGDKLLGGPQAGIIAGKEDLIKKLKKHQLARVLRVDKMTLAALEGTLLDYIKGEAEMKNIPVVRDVLTTREELQKRTEHFLRKLEKATENYYFSMKESIGQVGGGTMPDVELPSWVAVLKHKQYSAEHVGRQLRTGFSPSIIVRIQKEEILIDLRTVTAEEEEIILNALSSL